MTDLADGFIVRRGWKSDYVPKEELKNFLLEAVEAWCEDKSKWKRPLDIKVNQTFALPPSQFMLASRELMSACGLR